MLSPWFSPPRCRCTPRTRRARSSSPSNRSAPRRSIRFSKGGRATRSTRRSMYDSLVGFDLAKGGVGPGVAERWELSPDGLAWTFHIRPGQNFHNGDKLTAEDVKFSLERQMGPTFARLRRGQHATHDQEHRGDRRADGEGATPPRRRSACRPACRARWRRKARSCPRPISRRSARRSSARSRSAAAPGSSCATCRAIASSSTPSTMPHWRGRPHFKDLHMLLVPEESTRMAMVRTGEAAIASIGPETMLSASRAGLEVLSVPGTMQALYPVLGHVSAGGQGFSPSPSRACARRCRWRSTASR